MADDHTPVDEVTAARIRKAARKGNIQFEKGWSGNPPKRCASYYIECDCGWFGHTVRLSYWPDDGEVYIDVCLVQGLPWWQRLRVAFWYLIGVRGPYGFYFHTVTDVQYLGFIVDHMRTFQDWGPPPLDAA